MDASGCEYDVWYHEKDRKNDGVPPLYPAVPFSLRGSDGMTGEDGVGGGGGRAGSIKEDEEDRPTTGIRGGSEESIVFFSSSVPSAGSEQHTSVHWWDEGVAERLATRFMDFSMNSSSSGGGGGEGRGESCHSRRSTTEEPNDEEEVFVVEEVRDGGENTSMHEEDLSGTPSPPPIASSDPMERKKGKGGPHSRAGVPSSHGMVPLPSSLSCASLEKMNHGGSVPSPTMATLLAAMASSCSYASSPLVLQKTAPPSPLFMVLPVGSSPTRKSASSSSSSSSLSLSSVRSFQPVSTAFTVGPT